jgi:enoyl-CoA hydratase/carnithine racemase
MRSLKIEKAGTILKIIINRPERLNSLDIHTLCRLRDAWIDFEGDDSLKVAILTGEGERAFCCGADLKELALMSPEQRRQMSRPQGIHKGLDISKPTIAAVNGLALGGGLELALACDIRVASEKARFGLTEIKHGLVPGGGGTQRLPRAIPVALAMEMALTGREIDADEAYRIGLVNRVVAHSQLMNEAISIAEKISEKSLNAIKVIKSLIRKGMDMPLESGLILETIMSRSVRDTSEAKEGIRRFSESRT